MCWKTPEADIPLHSEPRPEGLGPLEVTWRRPWTSIWQNKHTLVENKQDCPFPEKAHSRAHNPEGVLFFDPEERQDTQHYSRRQELLGRPAIESVSALFYISAICGSEGGIEPKQKLTSLRQLWYIVLFFTHASLFQDFAVMSCRMLWHWFYRGCHCHHYVL